MRLSEETLQKQLKYNNTVKYTNKYQNADEIIKNKYNSSIMPTVKYSLINKKISTSCK